MAAVGRRDLVDFDHRLNVSGLGRKKPKDKLAVGIAPE
jgi:hypothetical protein